VLGAARNTIVLERLAPESGFLGFLMTRC